MSRSVDATVEANRQFYEAALAQLRADEAGTVQRLSAIRASIVSFEALLRIGTADSPASQEGA